MSYIAKNGRLYTSGASEALTLLDDKFSVNKSYSKGDSCIYNDYLWKFTSDKPAGEWDSSVVEQCRIMDFVDDINGRLMQKNTNDYMTAYNGSSEYIIAVGKCHLPMNVDVALSIYIPKSAITSTKVFWQVTDSYNNATAIHMQIAINNEGCTHAGVYYGAEVVAGATIEYYYR